MADIETKLHDAQQLAQLLTDQLIASVGLRSREVHCIGGEQANALIWGMIELKCRIAEMQEAA